MPSVLATVAGGPSVEVTLRRVRTLRFRAMDEETSSELKVVGLRPSLRTEDVQFLDGSVFEDDLWRAVDSRSLIVLGRSGEPLEIEVEAWAPGYEKTVVRAWTDADSSDPIVPIPLRGKRSGRHTLEVAAHTGSGDPISGPCRLVLAAKGELPSDVELVFDASGRARVEGLPPGDYLGKLEGAGPPGAFWPRQRQWAAATLPSGPPMVFQVPVARVEVRVSDEAGNEVRGYGLRARIEGRPTWNSAYRWDRGASAAAPYLWLPVGNHLLQVVRQGRLPSTVQFSVAVEQPASVLNMPLGAESSGKEPSREHRIELR